MIGKKFEEQVRKMLQTGYTQQDVIVDIRKTILKDVAAGEISKEQGDSDLAKCVEIIREVAREERMKRFNVGFFGPGSVSS